MCAIKQHRYRQDYHLIHNTGTPPERQGASEGLLNKLLGQLILCVENKWTFTFVWYIEDVVTERSEAECAWQDENALKENEGLVFMCLCVLRNSTQTEISKQKIDKGS